MQYKNPLTICGTQVVDVSIEYSHIYTDQRFNIEQAGSICLLKEAEHSNKGKNISRVVLIDDYSPNISIERFNLSDFLKQLSILNAEPNVVVCESELAFYCEKTLTAIGDKKVKRGIENYIKSRNKYPCSLFVASWYLLRLGVFGKPQLMCLLGQPEHLLSKEIITIVPSLYEKFETAALKIIQATEFEYSCKAIRQIYFDNRKKYNDWLDFDTDEYWSRNYGKQILLEDKEIIKFAISEIKKLGIKKSSFKKVLEIGVGPNLYPSMLVAPYIANNGIIELKDRARPNLEYLVRLFSSRESKEWTKFEDLIIKEGGKIYQGVIQKLFNIAKVSYGDIYRLPKNKYDAGISFFVTESITNTNEGFLKALHSLVDSVKPGGLLLISHMVKSKGYHAGEGTNFPAVNLSIEDIEEAYSKIAQVKIFLVNHKGSKPARKGYAGMALIVGKKI